MRTLVRLLVTLLVNVMLLISPRLVILPMLPMLLILLIDAIAYEIDILLP